MVLNDDFPVALGKFLPLLRGTPDEVWGKILTLDHGQEKHTEAGWMVILRTYTNPAVRARR